MKFDNVIIMAPWQRHLWTIPNKVRYQWCVEKFGLPCINEKTPPSLSDFSKSLINEGMMIPEFYSWDCTYMLIEKGAVGEYHFSFLNRNDALLFKMMWV